MMGGVVKTGGGDMVSEREPHARSRRDLGRLATSAGVYGEALSRVSYGTRPWEPRLDLGSLAQ